MTSPPSVLVAYGTRRGGTQGIAEAIAGGLRAEGLDVDCARAQDVDDLASYDAVVLGGALYFGRWVHEARRFARRHRAALRARPVWLFSSGPLDDSAQVEDLPAVHGVAATLQRLGARGHATFGGRLEVDASGFLASAMARKQAGDWRSWPRIAEWARAIASELTAPALPEHAAG